jgi:hypothetical protein
VLHRPVRALDFRAGKTVATPIASGKKLISPADIAKMRLTPLGSLSCSGRTFIMRLTLIAAVAALSACASTPPNTSSPRSAAPAPPPKAVTNTAQPSKSTTPDKFAVIDGTNIAEAQRAGYKVVNENGTQLFCRKDQITGTRAAHRTICLTAAEMQERAAKGREAITPTQVPYMGPPGR